MICLQPSGTVRAIGNSPPIRSRWTNCRFCYGALRELRKCWETASQRSGPCPPAGRGIRFETYLAINWVAGLKPGVYRYLAVEHQLEFLFEVPGMIEQLQKCGVGQKFVGECAVCFIWSCIPYRGEWRYTIGSHKVMLLDAGHVCQNLYLACEAIGCGTCAVGAYKQEIVDEFLHLDGKDEFVIYMSPVGRVSS